MNAKTLMLGCALALAGTAIGAPHAAACGGCFGPNGQPTVVTAHRMAVSIAPHRTILWDQFEYAGSPEDFVWVLPVRGDQDVQVELADNAFFQALQQETAIQLTGPLRPTGTPSSGGGGFGCGASDGAYAEERGPDSPPVNVYYEGTVGPYETVTIGSEDPAALVTFMQDHGYAVPDEMLPIIEHYVGLGMNFVALRLAPGSSVTRMQPVRVITTGTNVVFPLRMVSAGVADSVALELFVIGEGRYEAANFPNGLVDREALSYDWATTTYNYDALAEEALAADGGRTWLTEFAGTVNDYSMTSFQIQDEGGVIHRAVLDWAEASEGIAYPSVTRMRAELPVSALDDDLVLQASLAGSLDRLINVTQDTNFTTAAIDRASDDGTRMAAFPGSVLVFIAAGLGFAVRRRRRG